MIPPPKTLRLFILRKHKHGVFSYSNGSRALTTLPFCQNDTPPFNVSGSAVALAKHFVIPYLRLHEKVIVQVHQPFCTLATSE